MSSQTCAYVASNDNPESWHGTDSSEFALDVPTKGLGITEWHCPHPPLGEDDSNDQCCVFHTDPAEIPDDVDQREALLDAVNEAGDGPQDDRPEHRGQFVGATFGGIDLSGKTIAATEDYDIRFDHAQFRADNGDLDFSGTTFLTQGQRQISFYRATFRTDGDGNVGFREATFRTDGGGNVGFKRATFRTDGDDGVSFRGATFRTDGGVWFVLAAFSTDGGVWFVLAAFSTDGVVSFRGATFRTDGGGDVRFGEATLTNVDLRGIDFAEADFRGADITNTDLREANVADISVDGSTVCERLYEGYGSDWAIPVSFSLSVISSILFRLRRLYSGSDFDSREEWDATARAYHNLKTAFGGHGLVGKARTMHVRERRARSLEAKAEDDGFNRRYLGSLPSRVVTGYGVRVRNLVFWMLTLFLGSTAVYLNAFDKKSVMETVSYSVLAFTVAPPEVPDGTGTQLVMMMETFLGTLFIVLLGYILGTRDQF